MHPTDPSGSILSSYAPPSSLSLLPPSRNGTLLDPSSSNYTGGEPTPVVSFVNSLISCRRPQASTSTLRPVPPPGAAPRPSDVFHLEGGDFFRYPEHPSSSHFPSTSSHPTIEGVQSSGTWRSLDQFCAPVVELVWNGTGSESG